MSDGIKETFTFLWKQMRALIFPLIFFALLIASHVIQIPGLSRYDFLFFGAVLAQLTLLWTRVETMDEVKVIAVFHLIGLGLELFKTQPGIGSWAYPEEAVFRVSTVPLYSGFMYATVASYLCQAWRLFDVKLTDYPRYWLSIPLCLLIYGNFFSHHFMVDLRWVLKVLVLIVFWPTMVQFTVRKKERRIPLILCFVAVGLMVWVAENISTFYGAFVYPNQKTGWALVSFGKMSSWMLLVILSFIIVADLKFVKARKNKPLTESTKREGQALGLSLSNFNMIDDSGEKSIPADQ
ncbi:MAG: DUF817 domain-containing protein [Planctomycetota bacterium]|nr:DUF817 domain-containing protein [Planctomycetota bacterium]